MASRKSCEDCCWGSFCGETVHISFPPNLTPTEECRNGVFCYWLIGLTCTLCLFLSLNQMESRHVNWWATYSAGAQLVSNILCLGKKTCYGVYSNGTNLSCCPHSFSLFYCWVPCVIEITDCCDFTPNKYGINQTNNCLVHPFYMFGPSPFRQWRSSRAF